MGEGSGPGGATVQRNGGAGYRLFRADDSAARNSFVIAALWLVFGTAMGLTLAIEFVFPDAVSWLPFVFSRLRQEHTNTVMFGFLSTGMIGLWYYILPRLTGRRLWSEALANLVLALWTVGVLVGVVLIAMAHTQSREYAEMVWGVDIAILVALAINLVIVLMTIAHRVEPKLYVTLWFIIGTAMWMPLLYAIGNVVWNPPTGALTGINDAVWNWFYGHNVLGLWFTTGMLGVFYYLLPKETHTPLYSVKLGPHLVLGDVDLLHRRRRPPPAVGPDPRLAQGHGRGREHRHDPAGDRLLHQHRDDHARQLEPLLLQRLAALHAAGRRSPTSSCRSRARRRPCSA